MLALYTDKASLDEYCESYSMAGEAVGPGYAAGGVQLTGFRVVDDGCAVVLTFDDAHWDRVSISGVVGGLIYNASKKNRAVGVVALEQATSATNGAFDLYFPPATASEGLFVID
ncbi:MAG: hypothetical protein ACKOW0_00875 [Schleiferiaceae bacterium]